MEYKVSVIIPVFNMESYLKQSMDSVLQQTLENIEIICVDDGSIDSSITLLRQYAAKDTRIKLIEQKNHGVAYARNVGIKAAKGKYIAFLDPDDYYPEKETLKKLYEAAEEHHVKIAGGSFCDFDIKGKINTTYDGLLSGYVFEKNALIQYEQYQFDYGYHRFIYLRNFIIENEIEFPQLIRYQDPPFMVQAFLKAKEFYAIADATYCYRMDYKVIEWHEKRVCDLLDGLNMNLSISNKAKLKRLNELTVKRITEEYREVILRQFVISPMIRGKIMDSIMLVEAEYIQAIKQMILQGIEIMADTCSAEVSRVNNSISYRIGLWITYLPRKIIKLCKK